MVYQATHGACVGAQELFIGNDHIFIINDKKGIRMPVKEVFSNAERTIPSTPLRESVPQAHGQRSCPKDEYGFDLAWGRGPFGTPRYLVL